MKLDNMPLISVVVAVYNSEDYVRKCLESIVNQTYKNLEIIVVEDGSTDGSRAVCKQMADSDDRIKLFVQDNMGALTYDRGLSLASGEYIAFVDGDDYIHPNYVEYLLNLCVENNSDISVCDFTITNGDSPFESIKNGDNYQTFDSRRLLEDYYGKKHNQIAVYWNKLYKRKCTEGVSFVSKAKIYGDEALTFKFIYNSDRVTVSETKLYYYVSRNGSVSRRGNILNDLDILNAYEVRMEFYKEHNEEWLLSREQQYYLSKILDLYHLFYHSQIPDKASALNQLLINYKTSYKNSNRKTWTFFRRCLYLSCGFCPLLYGTVRRIIK